MTLLGFVVIGLDSNFEVQLVADKNFYLPLTLDKIHAFTDCINNYLRPKWLQWHQLEKVIFPLSQGLYGPKLSRVVT